MSGLGSNLCLGSDLSLCRDSTGSLTPWTTVGTPPCPSDFLLLHKTCLNLYYISDTPSPHSLFFKTTLCLFQGVKFLLPRIESEYFMRQFKINKLHRMYYHNCSLILIYTDCSLYHVTKAPKLIYIPYLVSNIMTWMNF